MSNFVVNYPENPPHEYLRVPIIHRKVGGKRLDQALAETEDNRLATIIFSPPQTTRIESRIKLNDTNIEGCILFEFNA